jgi:hypothetical protein
MQNDRREMQTYDKKITFIPSISVYTLPIIY